MSNDNNGNTNGATNDTPAATPKALVIKASMGQQASKQDPAELEAMVVKRRDALEALAEDSTMPEGTRLAIRTIAALASPNKPGMEEMVSAWKVPRISIVQPTSQSDAKPEAAKNGDLYTSAGQLLERPWAGIPIYFFEENINFPAQGKNPVCQAPDAKLGSPFGECLKCPHLPFGKQNSGRGDQQKTDCQNSIVAVMLTADLTHPAVYMVQFSKTSRKAGSALMSLAGQQTAVWRQSYMLSTEKKTGDLGLYYVYKVEPTGKDNPDHVMRLAEALYGMYVAGRKLFLADWYARPARAPMAAVEAEGQFAAGALDAGLAGEGVEADLSTPVAPAGGAPAPTTPTAGSSKGARSSNKPM
jgi:hypothetical protein